MDWKQVFGHFGDEIVCLYDSGTHTDISEFEENVTSLINSEYGGNKTNLAIVRD
jgi:hypothetical protein